MQYSLLSRFRGTLLAAAVGEALGDASGQFSVEWQYLWQRMIDFDQAQGGSADLGRLTRLQAETLIHGDLSLEHWVRGGPDATSSCLQPAQVIAGMLPVILFFHEDEAKLGQQVSEATRVWQAPLELRCGALAVAYAIAQALRERLDPATLIAQTVIYLHQSLVSSEQYRQKQDDPALLPLILPLKQVQIRLEQGSGLNTTLTQLLKLQQAKAATSTSVAIALGFYCFLSTLEDFRLTVTRAVRTAHQPQLTALVAAALSGAFNSSAGVPSGWQLYLSQWIPGQQASTTTIVQLADQLMAAWSGIYQPTNTVMIDPDQSPAVAAPGVIRPR